MCSVIPLWPPQWTVNVNKDFVQVTHPLSTSLRNKNPILLNYIYFYFFELTAAKGLLQKQSAAK